MRQHAFGIFPAFLGVVSSAYAVPASALAGRLWPHGDPQALVRDILAQSAYREAPVTGNDAPHASIWDMLLQWAGDIFQAILRRLLPLFHGARGTGEALGWFLLIVSGVAFVFFLVRLLMLLVKRMQPAADGKARKNAHIPERTASAWHALSLETASQGRYGEAVAALFMAALRLLDERRVLAFDAARTPNEYRRCVAALLAAPASAFDRLSACFVRATYAQAPSERAVYETAADAYASFSSEVPVS